MITVRNTVKDITHLVVNGCSWTYCQGLDDPKTQGWPALLAKELGIEVVNLAVRGCGNDSIHRRTYEYVYENLPTGSKPFFVIVWSQYWRRETWYNSFSNINDFNDYSILSLPDEKPRTNAERALLDDWNELDFYRRTYLYKLSLINLFNSYDIPYIMTDYEGGDKTDIIETLRERFPIIVDTVINNPKQIKCLEKLARGYPKLPCGHDGVEAQIAISNYIHSEIRNKYKNLNKVSSEYLTLKNFKLSNILNYRDNQSDWL